MYTKMCNTECLSDGQYNVILKSDGSHELAFEAPHDETPDNAVDSVWIGNPTFSTYRLRQYCEEFHPEIDFDEEFDTSEPGVFGRYQEKFDDDYGGWIDKQIRLELEAALKAKGYQLIFE